MNKNKTDNKSILILSISFAIVAIMLLVTVVIIQKSSSSNSITSVTSVPTPGPEDTLPQGLISGGIPSMPDVAENSGSILSLSEVLSESSEGSGTWIMFLDGSSECIDQMDMAAELKKIAQSAGVNLIFLFSSDISASDPIVALAEKSSIPYYFDNSGSAYSSWQIQVFPSSIVMNANGNVLAYSSEKKSSGEYKGLLDKAVNGADKSLLTYIQNNMINDGGGIYTGTIRQTDTIPSGGDVLSESQGLLMQYAVMTNDRELFDKVWKYTKENMQNDGLFAWYITEDGKQADSNALLDDIRIYDALCDASDIWSDSSLSDEASVIRSSIANYCIKSDGTPGSFINFSGKALSDTISLCYLDMSSISAMASYDNHFANMKDQSEKILTNGMIDSSFPLYYGNYNIRTGKYGKDDLNTAEALYTLWHLAMVGALPDESYAWLSEHVKNGDLAARYSVNGTIPEGYDYHSSAVYGIAALIANEKGDTALREKALQRMERYRIGDSDSSCYGAFGIEGENFSSFDQCIPLIVYGSIFPEDHSHTS